MTALTCGNSEEDINIVINGKNHVKIPLFIASALFKSVVELLESDPTARELNVNVRLINNEDEFIRKFFDSLKNIKKLSLNEESDYMNIAILGKALGNGEFHRCFDGYKEEISINNVNERINYHSQIW